MPLWILSGKGAVQIMPFWKLGGKFHFFLWFCTHRRSKTYTFYFIYIQFSWVFAKCQWPKILYFKKIIWTCHFLCKRPRCYHSASKTHMSHFSYACKTEGENGISSLISALCVNCMSAILEYSRIIDYSIIWMCTWWGLLQKLHKIKKSEHLNSKVSFKL